MTEEAFVCICPHCDNMVKTTVEDILSGPLDDFRVVEKSAGIYEWRCPRCQQWYCLEDLDTVSMIEDGKISSNVDHEPTEHEKEQAHRFAEKVKRGEVPKPGSPSTPNRRTNEAPLSEAEV